MDSLDVTSLSEELLPGIPNDITLHEISTKLFARDVPVLSLTSQSWRRAVQSRAVYNVRVLHHSTETFVVLRKLGLTWGIYLYSLREKTLYPLPPFPDLGSRYEFIVLDGKLYVLGGTHSMSSQDFRSMQVLDLAGQRHWEQCASLLKPRKYFGCGVMDGKIYVFGGASIDGTGVPLRESEMYDPKVNAWFPIKPMRCRQTSHGATSVGEELFVPCRFEARSAWQVYHPRKDEWRVVEPSRMSLPGLFENVFMWDGKFCSMSFNGIHVYDPDKKSWGHRCSIACDGLGPVDSVRVVPHMILPVNNELLAMVLWKKTDDRTERGCLLQSSGFGSKDEEVVWSKARYSFVFHDMFYGSMCLLQL